MSKSLYTKQQYKNVLEAGKSYTTLGDAYKAYVVALADQKYEGVRATQTSAL